MDALTQAEIAVRLGITTRTVENYVRSGRFPKPTLKVGRLSGWPRAEAENAIVALGRPRPKVTIA